ncbi:MAG: hypothetical protein CMH55_04160 [Myxococcales bacterium]|nr:hypothetical protein [Myxococcales bacterium]
MKPFALIAVGAALGALLRWRLALIMTFPWGTTCANLLGCFILGILVVRVTPQQAMWPLIAIGFCGSLTTFSTFVFDLWRQGPGPAGLNYLALNLLGGFVLFIAAVNLFRPAGS